MILEFEKDREVKVGSLGPLRIKKGKYAYIGSAKAGVWRRVRRHLEGPVNLRWHIDHLSIISRDKTVFFKEYGPGDECVSAECLSKRFTSVPGFGSSDCKCGSHLFLMDQLKENE